MNVVCPNCHIPIEMVAEAPSPADVLCPSCGSSIRLELGSTQAFTPLKKIGKFEVLAQVGVGAFGTVYRARDPELDRSVAIKVPRAGNVDSSGGLERFLREARSVAQLRHPSIVRVHDVNLHEGMAFLVSDFVEGITLGDLLTARLPSFPEAATLMAQVADALHHAHGQGIVHRDVKPSNIMLEVVSGGVASGQSDGTTHHSPRTTHQPKLMDFGLAKRDAGEITMTLDGQVLGTPAYMSPEQAKGQAHKVDGRSDVYSVGVILYQLLTGELPFRGNTQMLLFQVIHEEPRPPRSLNHRIARDLETICLKCLEKDPGRRYLSAGALADDLRRWLAGETIRARPAGRGERLAKWARRRPALAALMAVSVVAVAVVVGLGAALYQGALDRSEAEARRLGEVADQERHGRAAVEAEVKKTERERAEVEKQRDEARRGREDTARQLERARSSLFTAQLWRAAGLWRRDPVSARGLLENAEVCPPELRDFAWAYYHRLCDRERGRLEGHTLGVMWVAISPDGATLASASRDGTVRLWDLSSNKLLHTLAAHKGGTWPSAAFSRDGATLYTGGADPFIRIWDVASGAATGTFQGHKGDVASLAMSPDGKTLASAGFVLDPAEKNSGSRLKHGELKLWELDTGQSRNLFYDANSGLICVAWSPDGNMLAAGHSHGSQARIWDLRGRQPPALTNLIGSGWILDLAFSPDSKQLAMGRSDHSVRICNVTAAPDGDTPLVTEHAILKGHLGQVLSVAFSPDQSTLASVSAGDSTVRVWDLANGSERTTFRLFPKNEGKEGCNLLYTAGGREILVGHGDVVTRWSVPGAASGATLLHRQVFALAVSPDGKTLAAGSPEDGVRLWPLTREPPGSAKAASRRFGQPLSDRPTTSPTHAMAYSPDGLLLAAAGGPKVTLWPTKGGAPVVLSAAVPLTAVGFSQDGSLVYAGGSVSEIYSWDLTAAGGPKARPPLQYNDNLKGPLSAILPAAAGHGVALFGVMGMRGLEPRADVKSWARLESITAVALFPAKERVAVASGTKVSIADLRSGAQRVDMEAQAANIVALAFSPDGKTLAGGGGDRALRVWDVATGQLRALLEGHHREVRALAFTPDGRALVSGSAYLGPDGWVKGGEIKVWAAGADPADGWADLEQDLEEPDTLHVRGRGHVARGEWDQALAAYTKALQRGVSHPSIWADRAAAHHRLGRFDQAAADHKKALEYQRDSSGMAWPLAANLLLSGAADAHWLLCKDMLERHEKRENHGDHFNVARTCSLAPLPAAEAKRALELAKRAVAASPATGYYKRTLATAHLRAGELDEAIRQHSAFLNGKGPAIVLNWLPLALAHHQAGRPDEARTWYDKAAMLLDEAIRAMPKENTTPGGLHPNDWLEAQALRREAAALWNDTK